MSNAIGAVIETCSRTHRQPLESSPAVSKLDAYRAPISNGLLAVQEAILVQSLSDTNIL